MTLTKALGGGGSGSLTVKDEGTNLTTSATSIDFVGAGVTATNVGGAVTVTIPGGSGAAWETYHPDTPPTSPTMFSGVAYDQEFVRDNAMAGSSTILGSPATSPAIVDRSLQVTSGVLGTADVKGIEWVCPGAAFMMTAKLRRKLIGSTFGNFGLMLRRNSSGSGNFVLLMSQMSTVFTALNVAVDKYSALTTRSSFGASNALGVALLRPYYMRWVYDGTNINGQFSFTGHPDTYVSFFSETAATFLGGAPGRYGIVIDNFGTTAANVGYCEWIRFT